MNFHSAGVLLSQAFAALMHDPYSADELAERISCTSNIAREILRSFYGSGLTYVSEWRRTSHEWGGGPAFPVWRLGNLPDATCDISAHVPRKMPRMRPSAVAFILMVKAMQREPMTVAEISAECGLTQVTVGRHIRLLRSLSAVRIGDWTAHTARHVAAYAIGPGKDVPKPRCKPRAEVARSYRERLKERKRFAPIARAFSSMNGASYAEAA